MQTTMAIENEEKGIWKVRWDINCRQTQGERWMWSKLCYSESEAVSLSKTIDKKKTIIEDGGHAPPQANDRKLLGKWLTGKFVVLDETEIIKAFDKSINQLAESYLAFRKEDCQLRANSKKADDKSGISHATYEADIQRTKRIVKYCMKVKKTKLSEIATTEFANKFAAFHKTKQKNGGSASHRRHCMKMIKTLLIYARGKEWINKLPAPMEPPTWSKVHIPAKDLVKITQRQVQRLFKMGDEQQKLCILLGLNCGWGPSDIGRLTHKMVNYDTGIVKRNRGKTNVRTEFRLWSITRKLLMKLARERGTFHTKKYGGLALINHKGNALWTQQLRADGGVKQNNTITQSFKSLARRAGYGDLSFGKLRKAGSQAIEKLGDGQTYASSIFLGHQIRGPTLRHYTHQSYSHLHEMTDLACKYWGFDEDVPRQVDWLTT